VDEVGERLMPLGEVRIRAMFGGCGIFEGGDMFGLISADSRLYLKVDDATRQRYEEAGAERFMTMPYFEVPGEVSRTRSCWRGGRARPSRWRTQWRRRNPRASGHRPSPRPSPMYGPGTY